MKIQEFIDLIDGGGSQEANEADVAIFESNHSLSLPEDYRAFLAKTAGGRVRHNVYFSISGGADDVDTVEIMGMVYGVSGAEAISLSNRLANAEKDAIPQGLLPIMRDRGGNFIAMVMRADRLGELIFLDHEVSEEGCATLEAAEAEDWGYAISFASSFTDMIAGCRFEPQD